MNPNQGGSQDPHQVSNYQEFYYNYVLPEDDIVETVDDGILKKLTPLEAAFVRWMIRVDDPMEAVKSLIRPSAYFDEKISNGREILARATVSDALNKIRKKFPFLTKYTLDYTLGLIHEEVEWLRAKNRRKRYDTDTNFTDRMFAGSKKSWHDGEIEDTRLLVDLLKLVQQLTTITGSDGSPLPASESGASDSRINRVLAEAREQILGRKDGDLRPPGRITD